MLGLNTGKWTIACKTHQSGQRLAKARWWLERQSGPLIQYKTFCMSQVPEGGPNASVLWSIYTWAEWWTGREEVTLLCWRVSYRSRGERLKRYTLIYMPILWGVRGVTVFEADTDGLTQDHIVVSLLMSGWRTSQRHYLTSSPLICIQHTDLAPCTRCGCRAPAGMKKAPTHAFNIVIRSPRGADFEKLGFVITHMVWKQ